MSERTSATRCSPLVRSLGVDPIGTAPAHDLWVLVEHPLPWPAKLARNEAFGRIERVVESSAPTARSRVQALVPRDPSAAQRTAIVYRADPSGPRSTARSEVTADAADLPDAIRELLVSTAAATEVAPGNGTADGVLDVLICTHGSRDVCCGSVGTTLFTELEHRLHVLGDHVRLWRTSHLGGHRFAPTVLTLPDGQAWAWLDARLLRRIVSRAEPNSDLRLHYRGSAWIADRFAQAVEREAFMAEGWTWLASRHDIEVDRDGDDATVRIHFESPDGRSGTYQATVRVSRRVPVPECGDPDGASKKDDPELVVSDLELLA